MNKTLDIGRSCIPLYETHFSDNGNSESLDYRYQNDVIKDIYNALEKEKKKQKNQIRWLTISLQNLD